MWSSPRFVYGVSTKSWFANLVADDILNTRQICQAPELFAPAKTIWDVIDHVINHAIRTKQEETTHGADQVL